MSPLTWPPNLPATPVTEQPRPGGETSRSAHRAGASNHHRDSGADRGAHSGTGSGADMAAEEISMVGNESAAVTAAAEQAAGPLERQLACELEIANAEVRYLVDRLVACEAANAALRVELDEATAARDAARAELDAVNDAVLELLHDLDTERATALGGDRP
jgi:hypothetical protein